MHHTGRARISWRRPEAQAICDRCGFRFSLDDLMRQTQWAGNSLVDTGHLVCSECLDLPQDQYRTPILPADPYPRINPRPDPNLTPIAYRGTPLPTSPGNHGFSQFILGIDVSVGFGGSMPGLYPADSIYDVPPTIRGNTLAVADAARLANVPIALISDRSTVIANANVPVSLLADNPARTFLLLYSPVVPQVQIALDTIARWGVATNLILGPGEAYFMATSQGLGPCYTGPISIIGQFPGMPFWCWEDTGTGTPLTDDQGNPLTDEYGIPLWVET